jgi:hypothetical protein
MDGTGEHPLKRSLERFRNPKAMFSLIYGI